MEAKVGHGHPNNAAIPLISSVVKTNLWRIKNTYSY